MIAEQLEFDFAPPPFDRRPRLEDADLEERANAVRDLIRRGVLNPWIGLALVCWPGCPETLS